jgi:hypothetical protein
MAKYSDDAKYVSAYNRSVAASNKAKGYLAELNRTKPGTPKHAELKAKYDAAKAAMETAEAERVARKKEIDDAEKNKKADKTAAKDKASAKADIPQLEYEVQAAKNAGDAKAQAAAEAALKAAKDKAAGIKPPVTTGDGTEVNAEEVTNNKFKDYTVNSTGSVTNLDGNTVYFVSTKNPDGSSNMQPYTSIVKAREEFLKNYPGPGGLDKLKKELLAKTYIKSSELSGFDWLPGLDLMISKYTYEAVSAVKYGGAKEAPLITTWFATSKGSAGTGTTSKAGTFRDSDLDLTTIGDAYTEINDYMIDALGREATQEEKDAYFKDINERELKSSVETVSVRDATGKITKTKRTGDFVSPEERLAAQNAIIIKALEGTDAAELLKSAKGSQVAVQIAALQKASADYGQPLTAGEALRYVIEGGTEKDAIAKQTERMRLNAMTVYGNLREHIKDGGTVKGITDQYAKLKAQKLGITIPNSLVDQDVIAAVTKEGGLMSTAEFNRQMQANPLWRQTDEAHDVAADFANTILKSFGVMG